MHHPTLEAQMTDPAHLNDLHSKSTTPLSKKLVEVFRDAVRNPTVARSDYVQRLKNEMEAALEEEHSDAARRSDNP